ncbi:MAG: 5-methylcytosine-specific restriction endonuclease McrA [Oleiphilaceae bacterium]|jgi:5-methylcytosine-specific restriction endonuclease McrA
MQILSLLRATSLSLCLVLSGCNDTRLANVTSEPEVKLSLSGICHDSSSASYDRTKNYKPFDTIANCIGAGGRLPKGKVQQLDNATTEAIEQGRAFVTLYNRDDWPHWSDSDQDCQNTRHEILIQKSLKPVNFKTDNQCNVLAGEWYDSYSGDTFIISKDLDLDHIVPLKFAHGHGADKWSRERKARFANDLDNLILTSSSLNRQKGAKGLDEWLPPNHPYRCEYIAHLTL